MTHPLDNAEPASQASNHGAAPMPAWTVAARAMLASAMSVHLALAAALAVGALVLDSRDGLLGVAAGACVGAANLAGLFWVAGRLVGPRKLHQSLAKLILTGKLIANCTAMGACMVILQPHPVGLILGWSAALAGLIAAAALHRSTLHATALPVLAG